MAQIPSMPVSAVQALASNLSVLEQARLPPTAIEMFERFVKQQTEAEAAIRATLPAWLSHGDGAWREISRARRLLDEVLGPGSAMQQLAEAARVTTERYATLFGPTSEFVNRLVPALRHAPAFQELQETIRHSVDAVRPAAERFQLVADLINRQVLGSTFDRVLKDAKAASGAAGLKPDAWLPLRSLRGLDVDGLRNLSEQMRLLTAQIGTEPDEALGLDESGFSEEEQRAVRESGEALAAVIEERFDTLDAKIAGVNTAVHRLEQLMRRRWRSAVVIFLLSSAWNLLLNIAASYSYEQLKAAERAVAPIAVASGRSADVVRDSRRAIAASGLPGDAVRKFRVVKRDRVPVFEDLPGEPVRPIARLQCGQVVEVVDMASKWRLVRWGCAEQGCESTGWVRAKHLGRLAR